jgi:DegT/DnrJ/EryC1/StrS aminotransferase family protein
MEPIREIASRHRLQVIEDAAHALPASYNGQMAGTLVWLVSLVSHQDPLDLIEKNHSYTMPDSASQEGPSRVHEYIG